MLCEGLSFSPQLLPRPTSQRQEALRVRAGSCGTQGRPPRSGSWCGPKAGRGGEPGRLSHFLPFLLPRLPPPSFLLPHRNREGLGHSPCGFPAAGSRPQAAGGSYPAPRLPPLSRGSQHRGAAVRPSSPLFLKCLQIQKRFRNAFRLREPEDLG